jgi:hypothetical protein
MTLSFQLQGSTATDSRYGIEIYVPRIVAGDEPNQIEYQYHVQIQGKFDGIGFFGVSVFNKIGDTQESFASLLLSPDEVLRWFLDVKQKIAYTGDSYAFLTEFSRGLLLVFEGESALYTSYNYTVFADVAALARLDVKVPAIAEPHSGGKIMLAELCVPCRGSSNENRRV